MPQPASSAVHSPTPADALVNGTRPQVDLDTALEAHTAFIRSAAALERLSKLPDAVSQLARAIESLGEKIEFGLCAIAGKFGE